MSKRERAERHGKKLKFGTLIQDSPMIPHSKFEVTSSWALAPPTGQSWTCIHVYNFWPIHPIFPNMVSLESLAEFNAAYVAIFRHDAFSAILVYVKNLQNTSPITNFVQSSQHNDVQSMHHKSYQRYFSNWKPFGWDSQSNSTAKPPNRK